jgi:DNA repair protein RecO (recombination protein O)
MQIHHTKGIVLRTVKYGESSVITTVYTELFGIQSYMVKGVRQTSKKSSGKAGYFQPAAILDMEVYHNEFKTLQFVKDYQWGFLYQTVLFDVVKNSVALFMIELLQHSLKQPEANPELFYLIEDSLKQLDAANATLAANLPLYFSLHLAGELGFSMQGKYEADTPVLDLQDGNFVASIPPHPYFIDGQLAETTSALLGINFYTDLENIQLNRTIRRQLLQVFQSYFALHISDFGDLKTQAVLQEVLG